MLTENKYENSADDFERQYPRSYFPWEDYEFDEAQDKGMFFFDFELIEMPRGKAHMFSRNKFEHIYCHLGCAYYV